MYGTGDRLYTGGLFAGGFYSYEPDHARTAHDAGCQLRQYAADGYTAKCDCIFKRSYTIEANAEGRIYYEYSGSNPDYFVLLVPAANTDENCLDQKRQPILMPAPGRKPLP